MPAWLEKKCSNTITAPKGARINPYSATNPKSFIANAGKIPASVATDPAIIVTQKVETLGMMA